MTMAMMQIGVVWVPVYDADVPMPVRVRFASRISRGVLVLMVVVVMVPVLVFHGFVQMFVLVPLGQVQPQTKRHQPAGDHKLCR